MGEYFPVSIIRGYTKSTLPMEGRFPHRLSPTTPPTPPSLSPRSLSPPFPDPFLSSASLPSPGIPPPLLPPLFLFILYPLVPAPPQMFYGSSLIPLTLSFSLICLSLPSFLLLPLPPSQIFILGLGLKIQLCRFMSKLNLTGILSRSASEMCKEFKTD